METLLPVPPKQDPDPLNWSPLNDTRTLEDLDASSFLDSHQAILIFKHSTRCSISAMSLSRLERKWDVEPSKVPAYFLDLLNHRDISNAIAEKYQVEHQSPQVLLIKNGKCIYDASHGDIEASEIKRHLAD